MAELKKVIKGLELCTERGTAYQSQCPSCPYYPLLESTKCIFELHADALALLKAQEPRVMTLEEWKNLHEPKDGECLCYELSDGTLKAMLCKVYTGCEHLYGKKFRVWTSRPTDEQRLAVKWDD